jgi:CRP-like cAMP-binding protein
MAGQGHQNPANHLLAALSPKDWARLQPRLQRISLEAQQRLYDQGGRIAFVYFPTSAVVSMLSVMEDGQTVEGATIGHEGMVGVSAFLGTTLSVARIITQVPGTALRMKVSEFRQEIERNQEMAALIGRFTSTLLAQIFRSVGCSQHHALEQRCARWLLMSHDRARTGVFPFTQTMLSEMLGVRRPSVSVAAGALQRAGLIRYSRGNMTILNRKGLESATCECYHIVAHQLKRVLK